MKVLLSVLILFLFHNLLLAQEQETSTLNFTEIDSLIVVFYQKGDYSKAIEYAQLGCQKATSSFGELDSLHANFLSNLGVLHSMNNEYTKAEEALLKTVNIRRKLFGVNHLSYLKAVVNLAGAYNDLGQYRKAESLYVEALEKYEKLLETKNESFSSCLNNLASLYSSIRQYGKAEKLYLKALDLEVESSGTNSLAYAKILMNLGNLYRSIAYYDKAESLLLEAKAIFLKELGETDSYYPTILSHLGGLYESMGAYEKAEVTFRYAVDLDKKNLGTDDPYYAMSLHNLANMYSLKKDYRKAIELYLEALAINKKVYGDVHPDIILNLERLAKNYLLLHKYEKAESIYTEILELTILAYGKDEPSYPLNLKNLGVVNMKLGKYSKAEKLLLQAKSIYKEVLGDRDYLYIDCLNEIAVLYGSMNFLPAAKESVLQSLIGNSSSIDDRILDLESYDITQLATFNYNSNVRVSTSLQILLDLLEKEYQQTKNQHKLEQHFILAQTAMKLNERFRNNLAEEKDKLRLSATNTEFIRHGIYSVLELKDSKYVEEGFRFAELNKSVLLLDALKGSRARVLSDLPDSLIAVEIDMQNQKSTLKKEYVEAKNPEEKTKINKQIADLQLEIDLFLKRIKKEYPKYHKLKYANVTANAKDIQALLDDETLLLEYFLTDSMTYLFAVSKTELRLFPIHVKLSKLERQIRILRTNLSDYEEVMKNTDKSVEMYSKTAHWFYKEILSVAIQDKSYKKLIIVADGELGHLPFETFLLSPITKENGSYDAFHYLLNDYTISYNYSASLWKENQVNVKQKNNGQIFACAADYPKVDSSLGKLRLPLYFNLRRALKPIPGVEDELRSLSENFNGEFLTKEAANEKYFKENVENYNVIHLAMHGVLNQPAPMLSSLAFTENRDSLENNFLQAYEISRLNLNANLVVLSACETGYGKFEEGEGVISLARSFMYAGAPALIVSLWQVNDQATAEIMRLLYANLAKGLKKDEALRQAKLEYIQNAEGIVAHPAFWSPFIMLGNTEPISIQEKGGRLAWVLGSFFVGLVFLGGFAYSRMKRKAA